MYLQVDFFACSIYKFEITYLITCNRLCITISQAMEQRMKEQQLALESDLEKTFQRQRLEEDRKRKDILKVQLSQQNDAASNTETKNKLLLQAKQDSDAASNAIDIQMEEQKMKLRARLNKEQDRVKSVEQKRKGIELQRELAIEQEVSQPQVACVWVL